LIPGLALMAVVLAANLLGDWLRDWLDVKEQKKRK
jgi:peptide/nickel transport system permease protein